LGSNRPVLWAANGVVTILVVVLFLIGEVGRRRREQIDWRILALPAFAFTSVIAWMVVQTIPGVPAALQHPIWEELAGHVDRGGGAISVNPGSTWVTIVEVAPAGLLAIVAAFLAFDPKRAEFLLRLIVIVTLATAGYGLVAQYVGVRQVILLDDDAYSGFLTGTFVNRNTAATYFVVGIACSTTLIAWRLESVLRPRSHQNFYLKVAEMVRLSGLYLMADLVLVAALLDTGSRGGFIACGAALLTVTLITVRRTSRDRRGAAALFTAVLAAIVVVAGISSDILVSRLQNGPGNEDRLKVYGDTIDMIAARPWLGHGAGTFVDIYPLYHSRAPSTEIWTHAHNSYLQAAAELGLPALGLLLFSMLAVLYPLLQNIGRQTELQPAASAALATIVAAAVHSAVDFSLQIQAVGVTAAVLIGAGLGETLACKARGLVPEIPTQSSEFLDRETVSVVIPPSSTSVSPRAG
jgi:O-antigen ligase